MLHFLLEFLLCTIAILIAVGIIVLGFTVFLGLLLQMLKTVVNDYQECKKAYLGPTVEKPKVLPPPPPHGNICSGLQQKETDK
jgi:hypothetical protein